MSIATQRREADYLRHLSLPHIKRQSGAWICVGMRVTGTGTTPRQAYYAWQLARHSAYTTYLLRQWS